MAVGRAAEAEEGAVAEVVVLMGVLAADLGRSS